MKSVILKILENIKLKYSVRTIIINVKVKIINIINIFIIILEHQL